MEYTNSLIRSLIAEHIHSQRDRLILERRLIDGIVFEKLAEEFSMSPRQMSPMSVRWSYLGTWRIWLPLKRRYIVAIGRILSKMFLPL